MNSALFYLFLFVILLIQSATMTFGEDNNEIRFRFNKTGSPLDVEYRFLKGSSVKIILEGYSAKAIQCQNSIAATANTQNRNFVDRFINNSKINTTIEGIPIDEFMSTRWQCTIFTKYKKNRPKLYFHNYPFNGYTVYCLVHVVGAKFVDIEINSYKLSPTIADTAQLDYDGLVEYNYVENEIVAFQCAATTVVGNVQIFYYNNTDYKLFQTKYNIISETLEFHAMLTNSEHANSYLDCLYHYSSIEKYIYRTIFKPKPESFVEGNLTISVNGIELVPKPYQSAPGKVTQYLYRFIPGDNLTILCEKLEDNSDSITMYIQKYEHISKVTQKSSSAIQLRMPTVRIYLHNLILRCELSYPSDPKSSSIVELKFLSKISNNDLRILGLSQHNILYEYSDRNDWYIVYQYSSGDMLNITCTALQLNGLQLQWLSLQFGELRRETKWNQQKVNDSLNIVSLYGEFMLNAASNVAKIICNVVNKHLNNHSVIIILEERVESQYFKLDTRFPEERGENINLMLVIGVSIGVIVTVITLICLTDWVKRNKQALLTQNEYTNFLNPYENPIPAFPNQWQRPDNLHYAQINQDFMVENANYYGSNQIPDSNKYGPHDDALYTEIEEVKREFEKYKRRENSNIDKNNEMISNINQQEHKYEYVDKQSSNQNINFNRNGSEYSYDYVYQDNFWNNRNRPRMPSDEYSYVKKYISSEAVGRKSNESRNVPRTNYDNVYQEPQIASSSNFGRNKTQYANIKAGNHTYNNVRDQRTSDNKNPGYSKNYNTYTNFNKEEDYVNVDEPDVVLVRDYENMFDSKYESSKKK